MVAAQKQAETDPTRPEDGLGGGRFDGIRQDQLTYEYYEMVGEAAYVRARELESRHGPKDPEALRAYGEAAVNLVAVTWMSPNEDVMNDPVRMLRVSDSYAKLVQADEVAPYREPQIDAAGNPVDRREHLRRISSELLIEAGRLLMASGESAASADLSETISAEKEAGGVNDGELIVLRPEVVSETAEHAIEQLTGEHDVPPASEQLEFFAAA